MKATGLSLIYILPVVFLKCSGQRSGPLCPTNWNLGPCECSGFPGSPSIICNAGINSSLLNTILKSNDNKMTFRDISIHNTNLTVLQSNLFTPHEFYLFFLNNNTIETVQNEAFNGSEETAQFIRLDENNISSFSAQSLSGLKNLQLLQLNRNKITTFGADQFPSLPSLKFLDLSFNQITSLGNSTFAHLSNLERLDLSNNQITVLGQRALTIDNHQQPIQIILTHNNISQIDETAFSGLKAPFIDLSNNNIQVLHEKTFGQLCKDGAEIIVEDNPFECDALEMSWLKKLPFTTKQRISGLQCADGKSLDEMKLNVTLPKDIWN